MATIITLVWFILHSSFSANEKCRLFIMVEMSKTFALICLVGPRALLACCQPLKVCWWQVVFSHLSSGQYWVIHMISGKRIIHVWLTHLLYFGAGERPKTSRGCRIPFAHINLWQMYVHEAPLGTRECIWSEIKTWKIKCWRQNALTPSARRVDDCQ